MSTSPADVTVLAPHIVSRPGVRGGKPVLDTIAITVDIIAIEHELHGMTVDDLVREHEITKAQAHAALAYYYDHKAEIDARIEREEAEHQESKLKARLLKERAAGG